MTTAKTYTAKLSRKLPPGVSVQVRGRPPWQTLHIVGRGTLPRQRWSLATEVQLYQKKEKGSFGERVLRPVDEAAQELERRIDEAVVTLEKRAEHKRKEREERESAHLARVEKHQKLFDQFKQLSKCPPRLVSAEIFCLVDVELAPGIEARIRLGEDADSNFNLEINGSIEEIARVVNQLSLPSRPK